MELNFKQSLPYLGGFLGAVVLATAAFVGGMWYRGWRQKPMIPPPVTTKPITDPAPMVEFEQAYPIVGGGGIRASEWESYRTKGLDQYSTRALDFSDLTGKTLEIRYPSEWELKLPRKVDEDHFNVPIFDLVLYPPNSIFKNLPQEPIPPDEDFPLLIEAIKAGMREQGTWQPEQIENVAIGAVEKKMANYVLVTAYQKNVASGGFTVELEKVNGRWRVKQPDETAVTDIHVSSWAQLTLYKNESGKDFQEALKDKQWDSHFDNGLYKSQLIKINGLRAVVAENLGAAFGSRVLVELSQNTYLLIDINLPNGEHFTAQDLHDTIGMISTLKLIDVSE